MFITPRHINFQIAEGRQLFISVLSDGPTGTVESTAYLTLDLEKLLDNLPMTLNGVTRKRWLNGAIVLSRHTSDILPEQDPA